MGQYWIPVNLSKREFINPHRLGSGLKLREQLATHPGTATALIILLSAMPEPRGGGDFDLEGEGDYGTIARRTIGRWAGDRIALIGDYAEDSDLPHPFKASRIYHQCWGGEYSDISDDVRKVIEHELGGKFIAEEWGYPRWEQY